ncbi:MAG: hypothetical protein JRJ06_05175 [Deltaproteobacteria bacterium]|nr:hypothetical protein [Deltaproteobacteria bacterium]
MQGLTVYAPFLGILSLIIAWFVYSYVKKQPNGSELMQELEERCALFHAGRLLRDVLGNTGQLPDGRGGK